MKGHHAETRGGGRSEQKAPDIEYVQGAVWGTRQLDNMFRKVVSRGDQAGKAERGPFGEGPRSHTEWGQGLKGQ